MPVPVVRKANLCVVRIHDGYSNRFCTVKVSYAARREKGWVYPTQYGYDPDLDLFNAHRCEKGRAIFVVDDYFDVLRLYEQGITNVILAPTSEVQVAILLSLEPTDYFKSVESPGAA